LYARVNPKTYIVRVYRFSRDNPRRLVGVVEEIGRNGKKAFTGYQELWEILNATARSKSMKSSKRRVGIGGNCGKGREK
jgi:hypothetical protein